MSEKIDPSNFKFNNEIGAGATASKFCVQFSLNYSFI
jgi:hypothetical protein